MRAIIFDFDGTIADSFKLTVEIVHKITHRSQLVMPEEVTRLRKLRLPEVAQELKIPKWQWPFILMRGRRQMAKRLVEVQPFPGINDTFKVLVQDNYQLYIMSRNRKSTIQRFLVEHGLSSYFKEVYGGVSLLRKANALEKIMKVNQLDKDDVIYVGDEPHDIQASKKVGIPCVAVGWGFSAPVLLAEYAPMVVVRTAEQLEHVLEEWGSELQ
jgi:phosphoglycolate phosphatase-like HAD superfamily hydrolase